MSSIQPHHDEKSRFLLKSDLVQSLVLVNVTGKVLAGMDEPHAISWILAIALLLNLVHNRADSGGKRQFDHLVAISIHALDSEVDDLSHISLCS